MLNQYMVFRDQVTNIFWNLAKTIPSRHLRHFSSILGKQAVDQGELGTGLLGNQNLLLNLNGDFCFCLSCNETLDRGQLGTGLYHNQIILFQFNGVSHFTYHAIRVWIREN